MQELIEAPDGGNSICAGGFNPFGRQPLSQECVDYLGVASTLSTEFVQQIGQVFARGTLAQLPAGPLSAVVGAEYRGFEYDFDPGSAGGPISGFNSQTRDSGRNSFEDFFTELSIPLISYAPLVQSLELGLAYRRSTSQFTDRVNGLQSDESDDDAYKADLSWAVNEDLRVRTSFQRAVRAPNFGELFSGGGSAPQVFDPCSASTNARNGADAAQLAQLCVDTGIPAAQINNFRAIPGSQIRIGTTGNTSLSPEEADTFTFGFVFNSPAGSMLDGLAGSLDYYSIDISDPILVPDPSVIVAQCYNFYGNNPAYSAANESCAGISRNPNLSRVRFSAASASFPGINAGSVKTSGLDLQLSYPLLLNDGWGALDFRLLMNHLLDWKQQERSNLPELDYSGTVAFFGAGLGQSFPEWRGTFLTEWNWGSMTLDAQARYVHSMENRANVIFPGETEFTGTPSITYWDIGWQYQVSDSASFRLGLINAFDKQPPVYTPNVQSGTDPSQFDVIGRRFLARFNVEFD